MSLIWCDLVGVKLAPFMYLCNADIGVMLFLLRLSQSIFSTCTFRLFMSFVFLGMSMLVYYLHLSEEEMLTFLEGGVF